jgi:hypothetical protein
MASQRFISNVKAEIRGAIDRARSHAGLHDKAIATIPHPAGTRPADARGHMEMWEMYETQLAELCAYLNLAESGASDAQVKAAGYNPEQYRFLR